MDPNLLGQNDNYSALDIIDWRSIIAQIEKHVWFKKSKDDLMAPPRPIKKGEVELSYDLIEHLLSRISDGGVAFLRVPLSRLPQDDVYPELLNKLQISATLTIKELNDLYLLIESSIELCQDEMVELGQWQRINEAANNKQLQKVVKKFRNLVTEAGEVDYKRHPTLNQLTNKIIELEQTLRETLNHITQDEKYKSILRYEGVDLLNETYVLAIRSDSYSHDLGKILGHSTSGQTLYVEPFQIRNLSTQRIELLAKRDEIIHQLALSFSEDLLSYKSSISYFFEFCTEIDLLLSKALFSREFHLERPELVEDGRIELNEYFHILIENPIKNNLSIDHAKNGLIISGPNTGGKTVGLKSICLCALLIHKGIYVPARNAKIPIYDGIYFFSHDNQNLLEGLSSFSAEVKSYKNLLDHVTDNSLILIDEIFNSTSSEEASALAIGLIETIEKISQSKIILSTHHQMLKTFMAQNDQYLSAHVGFDVEGHRPTYKLHLGVPGNSMAFDIFDNLTKDFPVCRTVTERAAIVIDKKQIQYEALLKDVAQKQSELDKLLIENRNLNSELKNQKNSNHGILQLKRQELLEEYKARFKEKEQQAMQILEQIKSEKITSKKKAQDKFSDLGQFTRDESDKLFQENQPLLNLVEIPVDKLEKGLNCFCVSLNKDVIVEKIEQNKKSIQVRCGRMLMKVKISDLRLKAGISQLSAKPRIEVNVLQDSPITPLTLDCRGMRLEEFQKLIDRAIKDLLTNQIPYVDVIHGHGEGILKNWLRGYIQKDTEIEMSIPKESQDGLTTLKPPKNN